MPVNLNSIPAEGRTAAQIKAHIDLYNESQDIWLIHNPDEQDFQFYYNRSLEPNPYVVPNCNKDIGFGPGNLEIRYFLAKKYAEKKGEQMINAIAKKDWDEKKVNYRLEERGIMEERLALRTSNKTLWAQIIPQLLKGRVRRSNEGVGIGEYIPEKPVDTSTSNVEQLIKQLGLSDKVLSEAHEEEQANISEEEKRKMELINSIT